MPLPPLPAARNAREGKGSSHQSHLMSIQQHRPSRHRLRRKDLGMAAAG